MQWGKDRDCNKLLGKWYSQAKEWNWTLSAQKPEQIRNLRVTLENYKTTRRKHWGKVHDIVFANDFMHITTKWQATKAQIDKWDYIKLKKLLHKKNNDSKKQSQQQKITSRRKGNLHISEKGINFQNI